MPLSSAEWFWQGKFQQNFSRATRHNDFPAVNRLTPLAMAEASKERWRIEFGLEREIHRDVENGETWEVGFAVWWQSAEPNRSVLIVLRYHPTSKRERRNAQSGSARGVTFSIPAVFHQTRGRHGE